MTFVNRRDELAALDDWWARFATGTMGILWGRRRVGKTALLRRFAEGKRAIFFTGSSRTHSDQLAALSSAAASVVDGRRDLVARPFFDWEEALEMLAGVATDEPVLLVLDEFPELVAISPELPGVIRAAWDRLQSVTSLRILFCGSAVRTMQAMQQERSPLYGRFDLTLQLHPFRPHEAAMMLPDLSVSERASVWGIVGGVPLYLQWWDQEASLRDNVLRLACTPGSPLLTEGALVLATEAQSGDITRQVLYAIAGGRTKHNEIADAVRADPTRTLERLVELRMVERLFPVTEDPRRTRKRTYRIADNFLAFYLGALDRHLAEIERGLGKSIVTTLLDELDVHFGHTWEEAFRMHLRRVAAGGELSSDVVAVGPYWSAGHDPGEIDAVVLAGPGRKPILAGEAKWGRRVDVRRVTQDLARKAGAIPGARPGIRLCLCTREPVEAPEGILAVTAEDIFG
ncbi:ATP-binding protein [soil metagenome]